MKEFANQSINPPNRFLLGIIVLISAFLIYILIDSIFYFFIDDSISKDYSIALKNLLEKNNQNAEGISDFANLPFAIQNGIATIILGFIGMLNIFT